MELWGHNKQDMIPVILCGGSSERLWPVSSKPFHRFFEQSLFEMTLKRLERYGPAVIVGQESLSHSMENSLKRQKHKATVIYEPESKNTAPAVALACHFLWCEKKFKEVIGIFPSDHVISDESVFHEALLAGADIAVKKGKIVTLGLIPSHPQTGYGYIQVSDALEEIGDFPIKRVVGFVEKPDFLKAKALLKESDNSTLWNSGIFLCRVDILVNAFETHLPDLWKQITQARKDRSSVYRDLESVSFDRGIMEKTDQHICLVCKDMGWADLGSWDHIAEWDRQFPGQLNNKARVVSENSEENFVFSSKDQTVSLIGIKDTLVVSGEEGVVIAKKGMSESVREVVRKVKDNPSPDRERAQKTPWGGWSVIGEGDSFKCKILRVKPGHQLSYQSHKKRMEHWIVISGVALVILEGKSFQLGVNEHTVIPQGKKHRLKNPGKDWLTVLEIQVGGYLEENDINRYLDDYGRS